MTRFRRVAWRRQTDTRRHLISFVLWVTQHAHGWKNLDVTIRRIDRGQPSGLWTRGGRSEDDGFVGGGEIEPKHGGR